MPPDPVTLHDLHAVPEHRATVARLIHEEFWTHVEGASAERMGARLALAQPGLRLPRCKVALAAGAVVGTGNLVENDDERHPEWCPWIAGLVVAAPWRGRGVGSALVRALLDDARAAGFEHVTLGTDGPGFYARLGARVHLEPRPGFWFLRFDLG